MSAPESSGAGWRQHTGKIAAAAILTVCWVLAAALWWASHPSGPSIPVSEERYVALLDAAERADCRLISDKGEGFNEHTTEPVRYATNPPLSGPHAPEPAPDTTVMPADPPSAEELVHAGEHGRIVLQVQPEADEATIAALRTLRAVSPEHVLLTTNQTGMTAAVAATTWGRGITCATVDDAAIEAIAAFRDTYRDRGPESVD